MRKIAKQIFLNTLDGCSPSKLTGNAVTVDGSTITIEGNSWDIEKERPVYIIAAGKASCPMAEALRQKVGVPLSNICCITPNANAGKSFCIEGSHPVPDYKSLAAADYLLQFIENIPPGAVVLWAISGGASSLICKPVEGLSLNDIENVHSLLIQSGATIQEINAVRKHVSAIKGGRLLTYLNPDCTLIDLIISDVPGDDPAIIGSGPTIPDSSTFQQAREVLRSYALWDKCTGPVQSHIKGGLAGAVPETIKPGEDPITNHRSFIIGSAKIFARHMAEEAERKGFTSWVAEQPYTKDVATVAAAIAEKVRDFRQRDNGPFALVFYGESTVEATGSGKGGRNQELALLGALEIDGLQGVSWLSAGTDGIDGPTDAAGAIVDEGTVRQAEESGVDARKYLDNNDSYHFHDRMGTLLKTGPTGNNVMDVVLVIIE